MPSTAYVPKHRAAHPTEERVLSRVERDTLAIVAAAGPAGIPTENLRTRLGRQPMTVWGALWRLRATGLIRLEPELTGYAAYIIT